MIEQFLESIKNKKIHIVGVTGAEGSSILNLLVRNNIMDITAHDFADGDTVEKSFRLWHKGLEMEEKKRLYRMFLGDLARVKFLSDRDYLKGITSADIIFVPQSWRLYSRNNRPLFSAKKSGIPFYSLTRLYLDFSKATIIGVTGTVGKGSTANLLVQLLKGSGKPVYFAGNDTWMLQIADKLPQLSSKDFLILEISHRQIMDGFSKAPHITVLTNIYHNHLDEVSWEDYKNLKLSLIRGQKKGDISILNYDNSVLFEAAKELSSKVLFYSENNRFKNSISVQRIFDGIKNIKSDQIVSNMLAACTTASEIGIDRDTIMSIMKSCKSLPARIEFIGEIKGRKIFNDLKSTTPWATLAAVKKLGRNTILISGGRTKGINYESTIRHIRQSVKSMIILESEMRKVLEPYQEELKYQVMNDPETSISEAIRLSEYGDNILVSPGAAFFYSDFIKGKKSIRKIFEESKLIFLPQAVPVQ